MKCAAWAAKSPYTEPHACANTRAVKAVKGVLLCCNHQGVLKRGGKVELTRMAMRKP